MGEASKAGWELELGCYFNFQAAGKSWFLFDEGVGREEKREGSLRLLESEERKKRRGS